MRICVRHRIIQVACVAIGGALTLICSSIWLLGTQPVLHFTESVYALTSGSAAVFEPAVISATLDNELRFYATLGVSFGVGLLWAARRITERLRYATLLMALFFLGGVGRALSCILVGLPHPAFMALMAVELVVPLVVGVCYRQLSSAAADGDPSAA